MKALSIFRDVGNVIYFYFFRDFSSPWVCIICMQSDLCRDLVKTVRLTKKWYFLFEGDLEGSVLLSAWSHFSKKCLWNFANVSLKPRMKKEEGNHIKIILKLQRKFNFQLHLRDYSDSFFYQKLSKYFNLLTIKQTIDGILLIIKRTIYGIVFII